MRVRLSSHPRRARPSRRHERQTRAFALQALALAALSGCGASALEIDSWNYQGQAGAGSQTSTSPARGRDNGAAGAAARGNVAGSGSAGRLGGTAVGGGSSVVPPTMPPTRPPPPIPPPPPPTWDAGIPPDGVAQPGDAIARDCSDGVFEGDLVIETDQALASAKGCKQVEGDLIIGGQKLTSLVGLESLSAVRGFVRIASTVAEALVGVQTDPPGPAALDSLKGLDGLRSVGKGISLTNLRIRDLMPLRALETSPILVIQNSNDLNDLRGLEKLQWSGLGLQHNGNLRTLDGIGAPPIADIVSINDNAKLETVGALRQLGSASQLFLALLPSLKSLDGLQGLRTNTSLGILSCNALTDLTGLGDAVELLTLALFGNQHLTSLAGLKPGRAIPNIEIGDNPNLISLAGLMPAGESEIVTLSLSSLPALKSLAGLEGLRTVTGQITISLCDGLTDLSGLSGLRRLGQLQVSDCNGLQSLKGLDALEEAPEALLLMATPALRSLAGAPKLAGLGTLQLEATGLSTLEGLSGSLTKIVQLYLSGNTALQNLHGLEKVTTLDSVMITSNPALQNLDGLAATTVNAFGLSNNPQLASLLGMSTLQSVEYLELMNLPALTNLMGLSGLTSIGSRLGILDNSSLTSLRGLSALTSATMIEVTNNVRLPQCEVDWLFKRVNQTPVLGRNGPSGGDCPP